LYLLGQPDTFLAQAELAPQEVYDAKVAARGGGAKL
jgi:hypothetical protein